VGARQPRTNLWPTDDARVRVGARRLTWDGTSSPSCVGYRLRLPARRVQTCAVASPSSRKASWCRSDPSPLLGHRQGGRRYQWQKNGIDIPGATARTYTTRRSWVPTRARCIGSGWTAAAAASIRRGQLTVADSTRRPSSSSRPPGRVLGAVAAGPHEQQVVTWSMSDDVRICRVRHGCCTPRTEAPAGGGVRHGPRLPASFGPGGTCANPGVSTSSLTYAVPETPPSEVPGPVQGRGARDGPRGQHDHGAQREPVLLRLRDPDSVRTLVLKNTGRMEARVDHGRAAHGAGPQATGAGDHPRCKVRGGAVGDDVLSTLYATWTRRRVTSARRTRCCSGRTGAGGCGRRRRGARGAAGLVTRVYTGVKYVVLVGDDRVIPLARLLDRTGLRVRRRDVSRRATRRAGASGQRWSATTVALPAATGT